MRHRKKIDNIEEIDTDREIERRGVVYPLKVVKKEMVRHVNLLLTEQDLLRQYFTITNFSGLVNSQYNKNGHKIFYCYSCLHSFVPRKGDKNTRNIVK